MENLQELERKYEELGKEIERLKKQQNNGRVEEYEDYYYINDDGDVYDDEENYMNTDDNRYKLGNYFKTEEEAEKTIEKIQIYMELKRLAKRLNNGREIDWGNRGQSKYYIYFDYRYKSFYINNYFDTCYLGQIYCLDENFLDKAKQEIGEDRLKKLFE